MHCSECDRPMQSGGRCRCPLLDANWVCRPCSLQVFECSVHTGKRFKIKSNGSHPCTKMGGECICVAGSFKVTAERIGMDCPKCHAAMQDSPRCLCVMQDPAYACGPCKVNVWVCPTHPEARYLTDSRQPHTCTKKGGECLCVADAFKVSAERIGEEKKSAGSDPEVINCTPHAINIFDDELNPLVTLPVNPEWKLRVLTRRQQGVGHVRIKDRRVRMATPQEPIPFPNPIARRIRKASERRATLVTSYFTAMQLKRQFPKYRGLILGPDTGPESVVRVRGKIRGVRQLEVHHDPTESPPASSSSDDGAAPGTE